MTFSNSSLVNLLSGSSSSSGKYVVCTSLQLGRQGW
nr:MAG TPA: hypothetical protein [Caudoviricetes sp.]